MTEADFYVGRGLAAEYLGSVAADGYPELPGISSSTEGLSVLNAPSEESFRAAVQLFISKREDGTLRDRDGWPWPWETSAGTDYTYAFDDGQVWGSAFGYWWWRASASEPESSLDGEKVAVFPDMSKIQKVTYGKRSGLLFFIGGRDVTDAMD